MRSWRAVFATALVVGVAAASPPPAPGEPGLTLAPGIADKIDRLARNEVHMGRTPGIAIGVVEDGRLVYARGFGFANLSKHTPMAMDTEFYIGTMTMQFTAASILLLSQASKVSLDDKVSKFVPEFHAARDVTITQLLTQTSGLPDPRRLHGVSFDPTRSLKYADLFAEIDRLNLTVTPGGPYADNPLNYMLAGLIVERAAGVPLSDYLEQHIFIPLVMDHSFLAGDSGISPDHAVGYTWMRHAFSAAPVWDSTWLGGYAGVVSTIEDLAKWDIEMPILLRVDALRTMTAPSAQKGPTHYGMGWVVDRRGGKEFIWSNGEISGYRSMNALLPNSHVAVIVFSNVDSLHGGGVTIPEEIGARVLDILVPPTTARLDNAIVARAKECLQRLASGKLDRSELTPSFDAYLTDDLIARENLAALGTLQTMVPISSSTEANGDTLYEFLVRYPRGFYHYEFELAPDGKIDGIQLVA
jgi:D-alanyl-D-alanine carboxypeptidase